MEEIYKSKYNKDKLEEARDDTPRTVDLFEVRKVIDHEGELYSEGHIELLKPNMMPLAFTDTVPIRELHSLFDKLEKFCEKEIKRFR